MKTSKRLKQTLVQMISFGMVGVMNNVISLAVYYLVLHFRPDWYLLGNALGFFVSTLNAYLCNSRFVFRARGNRKDDGQQLLKTYCTYTLSLGVSTALLFLLVDHLAVSRRLAPLCALTVTIPMNYLMNRFWVYHSSGKELLNGQDNKDSMD